MSTESNTLSQSLFSLGQVVATPALIKHFEQHRIDFWHYLARHVSGDFGDLDDTDKAANRQAIQLGGRVFSAYDIAGLRIWIITEADRSSTTVLFPSEY
ncbi:MAG TPA: hypothetical protein PLX97_08235 [Gemmatales bacterium]|nr:hypothetical protein [Gemmatales bacterium]